MVVGNFFILFVVYIKLLANLCSVRYVLIIPNRSIASISRMTIIYMQTQISNQISSTPPVPDWIMFFR